jgi:hypothetical protein
MPSTV